MSQKNKRKREPGKFPYLIIFLDDSRHILVFPVSRVAVMRDESGQGNPQFFDCVEVSTRETASPEELIKRARAAGRELQAKKDAARTAAPE